MDGDEVPKMEPYGEDPIHYTADADDDEDEEEESSKDDDDEEEEHLDPSDSTVVASPTVDHEPIPFPSEAEVARLLALPTPPPSPLTPLSSPLPYIPSPPLLSPPTTSPTYAKAPLGYRAAKIYRRADIPEADIPPQKWLLLIAPTPRFEVGESSVATVARQSRSTMARRVDYSFVDTMDAGGYNKDVPILPVLLMSRRKLRPVRPWQDRSRNGDDSHDSWSDRRRRMPIARECTYSDFLKYQPLIFKGTDGVVGLTQWFERMESVFHISNCAVKNQVKYATCTLHGNALTWWNSYIKIVGHYAAYVMSWKTLMKMMTNKYCPRGEIKILEIEI
nr:reverse transcriptase domain-containing protein [Tanacetum cinerariifolium]